MITSYNIHNTSTIRTLLTEYQYMRFNTTYSYTSILKLNVSSKFSGLNQFTEGELLLLKNMCKNVLKGIFTTKID